MNSLHANIIVMHEPCLCIFYELDSEADLGGELKSVDLYFIFFDKIGLMTSYIF
jgi:hypothetical protein